MTDSLYSLLQHAAARFPQRPAIEFGNQIVSYSQLLNRADRAATLFRRHGAAPGVRVAFYFRKSIDALVALFGLIRTGATYVPLDPSWPAERCATICSDAGITLWIGTNPAPPAIDCIKTCVCTMPADRAIPLAYADQLPTDASDPTPPADGIANILYTSGSTGRPKGVQITTLSLLHYSKWVVEYFALSADDRIANHAPYNFDLSTLDIFAAVRAGACMCPVPERLKMFPYQMAAFIAERRITTWYSVPSALIMMQLRGQLPAHDLSSLRHLIFAGEVMPKPALQSLARDVPHPTYTNLYGPTETNVCTYHRVTPDDLASDAPLPIGRPIADTRVWLIDAGLKPLASVPPTGGSIHETDPSGEILVAGPTLTTGYFGDPALSAQRLIPAPDGRGVAYRTGDRGTLRRDGVLLFDGRLDRQIKCRGHRIEPGEIEAALARHPAVKEVAVVPLPDPVFGNRLKACLAPRDGATLADVDLIAFCRERLPPYMMPDVWDIRPALPRTDREKIDLSALMK